MITNFSKELHGAPAESFVTELAAVVGSLKTLRKMALFWSRVVLEVSCSCLSSMELTINGCVGFV